MSNPAKIILAFCACIALLHIWSAVTPMHENWGFHLFAFYTAPFQLGALVILIALAIPAVQSPFVDAVERGIRYLAKLPLILSFLIAVVLLYGLIVLLPAKLHLLGDGAILLRSVSLGLGSSEISSSFRNQPLMFWIYRWAINLYPVDASPEPYMVYYSIDMVAAVLFMVLLFWSFRYIHRPAIEKVLLGCLLFFGAGSQLFFGYVENYVLQYIATIAYVIFGWYSLEHRITVIVPILCWLLMIMLHLGNIVFWPSLIILLLLTWRENLQKAALILAAVHVAGAVVLFLIGFNPIDMTRHLTSGSVDFLRFFSTVEGNFPYPMFSLAHLVDWLNDLFLSTPVSLVVCAVLLFTLPKEQRRGNPALLFILSAVICGLTFTWVINSALGLARDWDLFAGFIVPVIVFMIFLLIHTPDLRPRRYVLWILLLLSALHWAAWIGINADTGRHLARMEMLNSPRLLSLAARMAYDETLANYSFDAKKYREAQLYYEDYMTIDSTNPRITGNIADVYRFLGERDLYFKTLQRAYSLKTPDPGVYSNLGVEYAVRGDTARAIELNEMAIKKDATMKMAYANLGILYAGKKRYAIADRYFTTAINLGMREPLLFRYAGDACVALGDYRRALENYDHYLAAIPDDRIVQNIRQQVYEEMMRVNRERK